MSACRPCRELHVKGRVRDRRLSHARRGGRPLPFAVLASRETFTPYPAVDVVIEFAGLALFVFFFLLLLLGDPPDGLRGDVGRDTGWYVMTLRIAFGLGSVVWAFAAVRDLGRLIF